MVFGGSCGNEKHRRGAELEFGRRESSGDDHRFAAVGTRIEIG